MNGAECSACAEAILRSVAAHQMHRIGELHGLPRQKLEANTLLNRLLSHLGSINITSYQLQS